MPREGGSEDEKAKEGSKRKKEERVGRKMMNKKREGGKKMEIKGSGGEGGREKLGKRRREIEVSDELKNILLPISKYGYYQECTLLTCTQIFMTCHCMHSHLFDIDVFLCTGFVQLYANLVCKLMSIFSLDYLFLWTIVPVSH